MGLRNYVQKPSADKVKRGTDTNSALLTKVCELSFAIVELLTCWFSLCAQFGQIGSGMFQLMRDPAFVFCWAR